MKKLSKSFSGIIPWKIIGKDVTACCSAEEAIRTGGLDYTVEKRPIFTYDEHDFHADPESDLQIPEIEIPNRFVTVRADTDQPFEIVGSKYTCIQNAELFAFLDHIIGPGHACFDQVGYIDGGKNAFVSVKLPGHITIGKNDELNQYLFISVSHDGSKQNMISYSPVRIACTNMLQTGKTMGIHHTRNAAQKLAQAEQVLHISRINRQLVGEQFNHWAKVRITDQQTMRLIEMAMAPNSEVLQLAVDGKYDELPSGYLKRCEAIFEYAMGALDQTTQTTAGTLFGTYNAFSGCMQHCFTYKSEEHAAKSMLFNGSTARINSKAFQLCSAFAIDGPRALRLN